MTDLSNEVSRHKHVHNYTNVQKTESYILRTVFKFFWNIDFQCPKGGFTFNGKTLNLISVSSWIYPMTKCGQSAIKIVYNHNNDDYGITEVEKMSLVG